MSQRVFRKQKVTFPHRVRYEKAHVELRGEDGAFTITIKNPKASMPVETHTITGVFEEGKKILFFNGVQLVAEAEPMGGG